MKERRIRIIAKERSAFDVGKWVLAVMDSPTSLPGAQLQLPLRIVDGTMEQLALQPSGEGDYSAEEFQTQPATVVPLAVAHALTQLTLPLDGVAMTDGREVA